MRKALVIPAQAGIQYARERAGLKSWTPAFAGVTALVLIIAVVFTACLGSGARAGMPGRSAAPQSQPLYTPVLVWKDCQAIARCEGCKPVYRCRSCTYQRTCPGGVCGWGDICVWGPYVRVLPPGARIIRE